MQKKIILLIVLVILLGVRDAMAHKQPPVKPHIKSGIPAIIQVVLALTAEQVTIVQEIFVSNQRVIADILENSGLNPDDMRLLHEITHKFRQVELDRLATVFSEEQILLLNKEIFNKTPLEYIVLTEEEKLGFSKNTLGKMSKKQALSIAVFSSEETAKHKIVLEKLGLNIEQILSLHHAMVIQRQEMIKSLGAILSEEQLELYVKLQGQLKRREPDHGPHPIHRRGGLL